MWLEKWSQDDTFENWYLYLYFQLVRFCRDVHKKRKSRLSTKHLKKVPIKKFKKGILLSIYMADFTVLCSVSYFHVANVTETKISNVSDIWTCNMSNNIFKSSNVCTQWCLIYAWSNKIVQSGLEFLNIQNVICRCTLYQMNTQETNS